MTVAVPQRVEALFAVSAIRLPPVDRPGKSGFSHGTAQMILVRKHRHRALHPRNGFSRHPDVTCALIGPSFER